MTYLDRADDAQTLGELVTLLACIAGARNELERSHADNWIRVGVLAKEDARLRDYHRKRADLDFASEHYIPRKALALAHTLDPSDHRQRHLLTYAQSLPNV